MISSDEARKKTENNINNCVTKELSEIMEKIDKAIVNGRFSISNDGYLESQIRKKLEEFGYKVETGSQYNESYYSVSW